MAKVLAESWSKAKVEFSIRLRTSTSTVHVRLRVYPYCTVPVLHTVLCTISLLYDTC